MPIDLNNMSDLNKKISNVKTLVPKLIDSNLTGNAHRMTGLFNKKTFNYHQIQTNQKFPDPLIPFGGLIKNNQLHQCLDTLFNVSDFHFTFNDDTVQQIQNSRRHVSKNHVNFFCLPLFNSWAEAQQDHHLNTFNQSNIYFEFKAQTQPKMFGLDNMIANYTRLATLNSPSGQPLYLYFKFIVTTVHTWKCPQVTSQLTKQGKAKISYEPKLQLNLMPIFVLTDDDQLNLMDHPLKVQSLDVMTDQITDAIDCACDIAHQHQTYLGYLSLGNTDDCDMVHQPQYRLDYLKPVDRVMNAFKQLGLIDATMTTNSLQKIENHDIQQDLAYQVTNLPTILTHDTLQLLKATRALDRYLRHKGSISHDNDELLNDVYPTSLIIVFSKIANKLQHYLTAQDYYALANYITTNYPAKASQWLSYDLRLLLADNLMKLNKLKTQNALHAFKPQSTQVTQAFDQSTKYSMQQKRIIQTTEPIVVGTAGAGSGKSHTLIGRLEYLKQQGEPLDKVLVLSFTNAAANNILGRYPNIQSMTLASLFNEIYTYNFPSQTLSDSKTMTNVLNMLNFKATQFKNYNLDKLNIAASILTDTLRNEHMNTYHRVDERAIIATLLHLLESYYDETVALLNAMNQTCLELQPLIIYEMILHHRNIKIPPKYQDLNYIITDESQDISTFEYILLLQLTTIYKCNLMIIGDGSQTLYEFRNANPAFLNTLETSKAFTTYHLTTNYRSNEPILAMANQFLNIIDANRNAKIQLHPQVNQNTDAASFKQHVHLIDQPFADFQSERFQDELLQHLASRPAFVEWLTHCYQNHEQIALLTWTRKDAQALNQVIPTILSQALHTPIDEPAMLNPKPFHADDSLSAAINDIDLNQIQMDNQFVDHCYEQLTTHITDIQAAHHVQTPFIPQYVKKAFDDLQTSAYFQTLLQHVLAVPQDKPILINRLKNYLIKMEIRYNNVKQYINRNDHTEDIIAQLKTAPLVSSTIHSAKGLEFDHTIVFYREHTSMTQEEARMYMVALTRAKKSEYIINGYAQTSNKELQHKSINTDNIAMFETPMVTAYHRVLNDLNGIPN